MSVFPQTSRVLTGIVLLGNRFVISSLCFVASLASHELVKLSAPILPESALVIDIDVFWCPGVPEGNENILL